MVVKGVNKLGYPVIISSNGITIELEPLIPGTVKDGDIVGMDLKYQESLSVLSANWDGFGSDMNEDQIIVGTSNLPQV